MVTAALTHFCEALVPARKWLCRPVSAGSAGQVGELGAALQKDMFSLVFVASEVPASRRTSAPRVVAD
jgi:hypothetical protein